MTKQIKTQSRAMSGFDVGKSLALVLMGVTISLIAAGSVENAKAAIDQVTCIVLGLSGLGIAGGGAALLKSYT